MPKRSNEFQKLISHIEACLNDESSIVTESKEILDKSTGEFREVDIVIESRQGTHPFTIGIECTSSTKKSKKRKANVEWVERMWGKHFCLSTDKLVLISEAGFTKQALKKAAFLDIATYSLLDASNINWTTVVHNLKSLILDFFAPPYATDIDVFIEPSSDNNLDMGNINLKDVILKDSNGNGMSTPSEIVDKVLKSESVISQLHSAISRNGVIRINFKVPLNKGTHFYDGYNRKRTVPYIGVTALCVKHVDTIELNSAAYGDSAVSHGSAKLFDGNIQIVAAQPKNGDANMFVSISRKKGT